MAGLTHKQITNRIPQRYPFLFVDKIVAVDKQMAIGIKNVSMTDPYLVGHFPGDPVFPGVLLVEASAQVGGVMIAEHEEYSSKGYIAQLNNFKFIDFILPGDTITIHSKLLNLFGKFVKVSVEAKVDDKLVGKGIITYNFEK